MVRFGSPGGEAEQSKFISGQIQHGGRQQNFQYLDCHNSTTACLISLKFGADIDHMTADRRQTFKVIGSKPRSRRHVMYQQ